MSWYFLTQHNTTYMHIHVYYTASSSFLLPLFFPPSSFSAIFPYTVPFCLLRIKIIKYLYNTCMSYTYTYMYFLYQYKHSHTHTLWLTNTCTCTCTNSKYLYRPSMCPSKQCLYGGDWGIFLYCIKLNIIYVRTYTCSSTCTSLISWSLNLEETS